jgi:membrane protein DedA with SNARE-associated domain
MSGDLLLSLGMNPITIAIMIFATTFVLEDAASVGAALLASMGQISVPLALAALIAGIFLGDLGLYGLGRLALTNDWARSYIGEARRADGQRWLQHRLLPTLIAARFLPGTRLPVYTASGFLKVPLALFAGITAGASVAWTGLVFLIVFVLGAAALEMAGPWKWVAGGLLMATAAFAPRIARAFHE